ncbi:APC membrane recruitment protein 1 [Pogona vitticeps]
MDVAEAACLEGRTGAMPPPVRDGTQQRAQEENGAADRLSGKSDASFATSEPNPVPVPAGKLKKTAFKLFGGKRSICTLPSFFGGKNKGPGKGASKKGLSKSKTHDGISDVGYEDASSGLLRSPLENRVDFPSSQLPTSHSALLGTEAHLRVSLVWPPASLSGHSEGFDKKPSSGEKSLFPSRPKKGLRGFFNSIRRHRKSKAPEPERTELEEWTAKGLAAEERAVTSERDSTETLQASEKGAWKSPTVLPDGGEKPEGSAPFGVAGSPDGCQDPLEGNGSRLCGEAANPEGSPDVEVSPDSALCDSSSYGDLPDTLEPGDLKHSPPGMPSNDQLSLMFGDVTSLKSFDSLTGCGDIIAEPDMDSMTENSTSADRSKEAIKRSSCLVTYQGGGEEMAVPDEIEEYLQQVWGTTAKGEPAYEGHGPERVAKGELLGANGAKAETRLYHEGTRNEADLLTPHSDQQESAPNSDEGYYDSATPGPEDEAADGLDEVKKERLPRDSYSGDALYEFYEPDDALMSPSREEPWFERKACPPEVFGWFFDFSLPDEKDLVHWMGQKGEGTETEEERLMAIQKQLLCWERQRAPALEHLESFSKDQPLREKPPREGKTRVASFIGRNPSGLGCEEVAPHAENSSLKLGRPTPSQDWKDLQEMLQPGGCLAPPFSENGSVLDVKGEHALLESCALRGLALEKSGTYPSYRTHSSRGSPTGEQPNRAESDFGEPRPGSGCELEQAVNFSQALVEFTSSGTLFSSLSESLGSSDSGSAFTQNLPALPTMVTFDIVDVEQDGEGECEQHLEMNTDEDIAASFEVFEESYLSKESFAECDERMFPGYPRSSFQSCNWSIASLPRRLHLHELGLPGPEVLSVGRRSRSLDTESLEFELASLQLSRNGFKPCEFWSPRSGTPKKGPSSLRWNVGRASAPCSPEEKEADGGALSWPGLQNVPYEKELSSSPAVKPWSGELSAPAVPSTWAALEQLDAEVPLRSLATNAAKVPPGKSHTDGAGSPGTKPMARPSSLPLQTPVLPQEGRALCRAGGDSEAEKCAWALPLGENDADLPPGFGFAHSPSELMRCKPVGVDARRVSAAPQAELSPS